MYVETHWEKLEALSVRVSEIAAGTRYGCHEITIESTRPYYDGQYNVVRHTMSTDQLIQLRDAISLHLLMRDVRRAADIPTDPGTDLFRRVISALSGVVCVVCEEMVGLDRRKTEDCPGCNAARAVLADAEAALKDAIRNAPTSAHVGAE